MDDLTLLHRVKAAYGEMLTVAFEQAPKQRDRLLRQLSRRIQRDLATWRGARASSHVTFGQAGPGR